MQFGEIEVESFGGEDTIEARLEDGVQRRRRGRRDKHRHRRVVVDPESQAKNWGV